MKNFLLMAIAAITYLASAPSALAGASDWFETEGARIRLISMPGAEPDTLQAGLQFELDEGWKTYWRSPGGSGIPPQIQFLGSQNVASTTMLFPVPKYYEEDNSVGYKRSVTFPIDIKLKNASASTTVKASGFVGVCAEICIPVQFRLSLKHSTFGQTKSDVARALLKAKNEIPTSISEAQRVLTVTTENDEADRLIFDARVPDGTKNATLLVEGPMSWYLEQPKLISISEKSANFALSLGKLPKGAKLLGTKLRLTLVADGIGTEQVLAIVE